MISTGYLNVIYDEEFENIFFDITIDGFHQLGFSYGDSIDINFSNGRKVKDIPYYSGYYCGVEELMLCGYPGDPHIKVARNCGDPTWYEFDMHDDYQAEIILNEKAKYLEIQDLFSLEYSDNVNVFSSLEKFANFRELKGGSIKPNYFYRSTSPCDNKHNRAPYTDKIIKDHNIKYVLNLSNSKNKYLSFLDKDDFNSPYYHSLYEEGNVNLLTLNVNYRAYDFQKKLADGFLEMMKHEGPVLVHCAEGKDRTGFVCAIILCLAGATYQDIVEDYMITYDNYYGITKDSAPKRYDAILENIYDFLYCVGNCKKLSDLINLDLKACARNYLKTAGLNDKQLDELENYINAY